MWEEEFGEKPEVKTVHGNSGTAAEGVLWEQ